MPKWVELGFQEYSKRMPREWKFSCHELSLAKRSKTTNVDSLKEKEAEQMLSCLPQSNHVVALDVLGKSLSTESLAEKLNQWQMLGKDVSILIGGPDGLHQSCLERANESVSLSKLTLPHPLVRIMIAEQLYRAWTITQNHPYHK